jgi:hypothetical protein
MIALFCASALAAPEWSAGAMASWRTTPFRGSWGPEPTGPVTQLGIDEPSWHSEAAIHAVGSWRRLTGDVSAGSELGWSVSRNDYHSYSGFRFGVRAGVRVIDGPILAGGQLDPLDLSLGLGGITWIACCSSSGGGVGPDAGLPREGPPTTGPTAWVGNRVWLWEPLAVDVRYEVPLVRGAMFNTVAVGLVYAVRE